jgi:hypothetical protein
MNGPESGAGRTWGYGHLSRQAIELAEGQKNKKVKLFSAGHPPPPAKCWRAEGGRAVRTS